MNKPEDVKDNILWSEFLSWINTLDYNIGDHEDDWLPIFRIFEDAYKRGYSNGYSDRKMEE